MSTNWHTDPDDLPDAGIDVLLVREGGYFTVGNYDDEIGSFMDERGERLNDVHAWCDLPEAPNSKRDSIWTA